MFTAATITSHKRHVPAAVADDDDDDECDVNKLHIFPQILQTCEEVCY